MRNWRIVVALLALLSGSCGFGPSKGRVLTLPSGHQVRVLSIGVLYFSKDKPAWWLRYETGIAIGNVPELRAEAQEVFALYRAEIDKSGRDNVALSANEPISNMPISKNSGYNFVWSKQSDGTWKMHD